MEFTLVKEIKYQVFAQQNTEAPVQLEFLGGEICFHCKAWSENEKENGDAVAFIEFDDQNGVLLLADGAGGTPGGNRASGSTLEGLVEQLTGDYKSQKAKFNMRTSILEGIEKANEALLAKKTGAATTLVVLEVSTGQIRTYNIGDSISILMGQKGKNKYQSIAHSPVGYQVEAGVIDEEAALKDASLNVVSNLLGNSDMHVELGSMVPIVSSDTALIASDGLSDNMTISEVIEIARKGSIAEAAVQLADMAHKRMTKEIEFINSKPDDLSFILYRPK